MSAFQFFSIYSSPHWMKIQPKNGIFHYTPHTCIHNAPYPIQKTVSVPHIPFKQRTTELSCDTTYLNLSLKQDVHFLHCTKKICTYRNASHSTYEGFTKMNQILSLLYTSSYTYRHLYNSTKNPYELTDIKRLQLYWKLHNMMITFQVSTTLFCTVFCTAVIWHSCCTKQKKTKGKNL